MIQTIFQITQILCGMVFILLLLVAAITMILSLAETLFEKQRQVGRQQQFETDKNRLAQSACWFGEDEPTRKLIVTLATDGQELWHIRDIWRNDRRLADIKFPKEEQKI